MSKRRTPLAARVITKYPNLRVFCYVTGLMNYDKNQVFMHAYSIAKNVNTTTRLLSLRHTNDK